jgi:hypothetical protein
MLTISRIQVKKNPWDVSMGVGTSIEWTNAA